MKIVYILLLILAFNSRTLLAGNFTDPEKPADSKGTWIKSEKETWLGGYNIWYKLDRKNNLIKFSHNKRKWNAAANAAWQGKQGEWLYIYEGKLMSNSNGRWVEVTDRSFQDLNGNWYRFNSNWELEETVSRESMTQN